MFAQEKLACWAKPNWIFEEWQLGRNQLANGIVIEKMKRIWETDQLTNWAGSN